MDKKPQRDIVKRLRKAFPLLVNWRKRRKINRRGRMVKFFSPGFGFMCENVIENQNTHTTGSDFYLVNNKAMCEECAIQFLPKV